MRMEILKESVELIRMELMMAWYWHLKAKFIKYVYKMSEYVEDYRGKFITPEAKEKWEWVRKTCEREAKG